MNPSIPLAPRLPTTRSRSGAVHTRGGRRGAMNVSRSRTGLDDPMQRTAPWGGTPPGRAPRDPRTVRSKGRARDRPRRARAGPPAAMPRATRPARPAGPRRACPRRPPRTAPGRRGSAARPVAPGRGPDVLGPTPRAIDPATKVWVVRVVGAAPTCNTTSGRWRSSHPGSPISSCPAASARPAPPASSRNPLSGSASTGHPSSEPRLSSDRVRGGGSDPSVITPATAGVGLQEALERLARRVLFDIAVLGFRLVRGERRGRDRHALRDERLVERAVRRGRARPAAPTAAATAADPRVAPRGRTSAAFAGTGGSR